MQLSADKHQQKSVMDQQRFEMEQKRLNAQTASEIHRRNLSVQHELMNKRLQATADAVAKLNGSKEKNNAEKN